MPEIELTLPAVLRADLDMLFPALVIEADFVVRRGAQHVTFIVADGDVVAVRRVVQDSGDIRSVRVAVLKTNRHFGARQQRQVQAVGVAGVRARLAYPQALEAGFPAVPVKQHVDAVAAVLIDMPVGVVFRGAGDASRERAGHHRAGAGLRAEAEIGAVRDAVKQHTKVCIATGMAVHRRHHHTCCKHLRHFIAAGHFQHLSRRERRTTGERLSLSLAVQIALMADTGVKRPGLRRWVAVISAARRQIVVRVVVGVAVGGIVAAGGIHSRVHVFRGLTVIIIAGADLLLYDLVMALHPPHRVHTLRMLP